jgi:hypothetical protein
MNAIRGRFWRYTKQRQGGGFTDWREDPPRGLGSFYIRVHQKGSGSSQVSEVTTGNQERDTTWGFIAPANLPLRATDGENSNVKVEMVNEVHGRFRLRRIRFLESSGRVIGIQGDLERIAGAWGLVGVSPADEPLDSLQEADSSAQAREQAAV